VRKTATDTTESMKTTLFLLSLFACSLAYSWDPIDYKSLPRAADGDRVELYYLAAPLLKASYGDILGVLGLYHGALGFNNLNNNVSFTFNYDADDFFRSNLFPEIITYPNGSRELKWDNSGALFLYQGIWSEYFSASHIHVATLTGAQYNDVMVNYIPNVNNTHKYYNMVNVKDKNLGVELINGWDCFDFCWETFGYLKKMNISLSDEPLPRNSINLYSSTVAKVEEESSVEEDIIAFYEFTQAAFKKMSLMEILTQVWQLYEGNWYVRVDDVYFRLQLQFPPGSVHLDHRAASSSEELVSSTTLFEANGKKPNQPIMAL